MFTIRLSTINYDIENINVRCLLKINRLIGYYKWHYTLPCSPPKGIDSYLKKNYSQEYRVIYLQAKLNTY